MSSLKPMLLMKEETYKRIINVRQREFDWLKNEVFLNMYIIFNQSNKQSRMEVYITMHYFKQSFAIFRFR